MKRNIPTETTKMTRELNRALRSLGIPADKSEQLKDETYFTLLEKCNHYRASIIVTTLHPFGYFPTPNSDIYIPDLTVSSRLKKALALNGILYLSQVQLFSREQISLFRNIGKGTMVEFEQLCVKYNIHLRSQADLKDTFSDFNFDTRTLELLFKNHIYTIEELHKLTTNRIYSMYNCKFRPTKELYYKLSKKGIVPATGDKVFTFEVFSARKSLELYKKSYIMYISEITDMAENNTPSFYRTYSNKEIDAMLKKINIYEKTREKGEYHEYT